MAVCIPSGTVWSLDADAPLGASSPPMSIPNTSSPSTVLSKAAMPRAQAATPLTPKVPCAGAAAVAAATGATGGATDAAGADAAREGLMGATLCGIGSAPAAPLAAVLVALLLLVAASEGATRAEAALGKVSTTRPGEGAEVEKVRRQGSVGEPATSAGPPVMLCGCDAGLNTLGGAGAAAGAVGASAEAAAAGVEADTLVAASSTLVADAGVGAVLRFAQSEPTCRSTRMRLFLSRERWHATGPTARVESTCGSTSALFARGVEVVA